MPTLNYTATQAAAQITRFSLAPTAADLSQPSSASYAYRATAPNPMPTLLFGNTSYLATNFSQFNSNQIDVTERAFDYWSDVANITFTRIGSGNSGSGAYANTADIVLGNYGNLDPTPLRGQGYALRTGSVINGVYDPSGSPWLDGLDPRATNYQFGNSLHRLALHEVGHVLGFDHPGNYSILSNPGTYAANALYIQDTWQYTLMSYFDETNTGGNFGGLRPLTPMMHDIAAAHRLYGANMTTRTTDTVYGFNSNVLMADGTIDFVYRFNGDTSRRVYCIWDAGGNDTIDASGYSTNSLINLGAGTFSNIGPRSSTAGETLSLIANISIAEGVTIENAIGGAGNDTLIGNNANNTLSGNRGSDTMDGGIGSDTVDYSRDVGSGGGAAVSVYLSSNLARDGFGFYDTITNFENVIGSDVNNPGYNDVILGNTLSNFIDGRGGGDIVVAGDGIDVVYGGLGTDAIYGGNAGDTLVGSGFTAAYNGEIDYLFGEAGDDTIYTGTAGTAYIEGGSGNDNITGGSGTDYILSGTGNDTVTLGGGVDLVILYATELTAGAVDTYLDFTDGYDFVYANASLASSATFVNGTGYSYMAITVAGGTHLTVFVGLTAAQVQDQIFFNL